MKKLLLLILPLILIACPIPDNNGNPSDTTGTQDTVSLFQKPDSLSPHFTFISRSYADMCYCWGDSGDVARKNAAKKYDFVMSGDGTVWKKYNPNLYWIRYNLVISTLDEANKDPNSITGKWQDDMRVWYRNHGYSDSSYEAAFLHTRGAVRDSANRLNPFIWSTKRFFGNPRDSIFTEYTRSRLLRGLDFWSDGYFFDEMDHPNLKYLQQSAEFADVDTTKAHEIFANWIGGLRQWLYDTTGVMPIIQTNAAGYSKSQFDKMVGSAAGSMHLELMNLATQEQSSVWNLIDELLAKDIYVSFGGAETWQDMLNPKFLRTYPGGNYDLPVYRAKVSQLASYYMVVPIPDSANPKRLMDTFSLQIENNKLTVTPDSSDLKIYYFNVGHPIESRKVVLDTLDALHQKARVWKRDFTNSRILYRAVNSWRDTVLTDTTKVVIPDSLISGYSLVKARGQTVDLSGGLELRNGEAAILVPNNRLH